MRCFARSSAATVVAAIAGVLTIATGCKGSVPCSTGTIFLTIKLDDEPARSAASVQVDVVANGGMPSRIGPLSRQSRTGSSESVVIALADRYSSVTSVQLDVTALDDRGGEVARGSIKSTSLGKDCSSLEVQLAMAASSPDAASDAPDTASDAPAATIDGPAIAGDRTGFDGPRLLASVSRLMVSEGDQAGATFTVGLNRPLPTPVVVTIASANPAVATVSTETVTFEPNSTGPLIVSVLPTRDDDLVDSQTTILLSAPDLASASVQVQVTDVDVQAALVVSPTLTITEGHVDHLSVRLAHQPAAAATVTIVSANPGKLSATPPTLRFDASNYARPQQVTLTSLADSDAVDDQVTVTISATDAPTAVAVPVTIVDREVVNLDVSAGSVILTEGESQPASVFVKLTNRPTGNVVVTVASSDPARAMVSPGTLTFTPGNYRTNQTIQIAAISDADTRDDTVTVTLSASGLSVWPISVRIADADAQALVVSAPSVTVNEGDSMALSVRLAFRPGGPVIVNLVPGNSAKVAVTPSTLLFDTTNYATGEQVTVRGLQDDDLADESVNVTIAGTGIRSVQVPVTITDDDKQALQVVYAAAPGDIVLQEMSKDTFLPISSPLGVRLAFKPAGSVTVSVTCANPAKLGIQRPTLTFTPDNYRNTQFVTMSAFHDEDLVNDKVQVTVSTPGVSPVMVTALIVDVDVETFDIPAPSQSVAEPPAGQMTSISFALGMTLPPAHPVPVDIISSDPGRVAVAPGSAQLTLSDSTAVDIKLSVLHDSDARDDRVDITIRARDSSIADRIVSIAINDIDRMRFVLTPVGPIDPDEPGHLVVHESTVENMATFRVALSADPLKDTTVSILPAVPGVVSVAPTSLTFTGGPGGNWMTPQTVTVTAVPDANGHDDTIDIGVAGPATLGAPDAFVTVKQIDAG